jgi:hypothetical protein
LGIPRVLNSGWHSQSNLSTWDLVGAPASQNQNCRYKRPPVSLTATYYNIVCFDIRNREKTYVYIVFMYKKSEKISRFQIKLVTVIGVSLELAKLK